MRLGRSDRLPSENRKFKIVVLVRVSLGRCNNCERADIARIATFDRRYCTEADVDKRVECR
jgi:hypothetical protein